MTAKRARTAKNKKPVAKQDAKKALAKMSPLLRKYLDVLQTQVPHDDMSQLTTAQQQEIAAQMLTAAMTRKPGKAAIKLVPDGAGGGQTALVIINDDMPFIIDSLTAEVVRRGLQVDLLFHPILNVARDKAAMSDIATRIVTAGMQVESHVYVRFDHQLPQTEADALVAGIAEVMEDVRLATGDWRAMLAQIHRILNDEGADNSATPADRLEARAFLTYLHENNFTFLGYRAYKFVEKTDRIVSKAVADSSLGILKKAGKIYFDDDNGAPEAEALAKARWPVTISKLIDVYSSVHRHVPLDVINVRMLDKQGRMIGMHVFVGLFTSSTYSCRTNEIPVVRQKVRETIENADFKKGSHDAKALEHILEKMPRDELFQATVEEVGELAMGILRLQAKQHIALFTHLDPLRQYMSCLVYVPRDRYNTSFRQRATEILEAGIGGKVTNFFTTLDDSALARILFTVRLENQQAEYDHAAVEQQLMDLGREWHERLRHVLTKAEGGQKGRALAATYGRAFSAGYHESIAIDNAVHDIRQLEVLATQEDPIRLEFYRLNDAPADHYRMKVYIRDNPVPLSDILPVLENMGLKALAEMPFEVRPANSTHPVWIHDFTLTGAANIDLATIKANFEQAFVEIWRGRAENDGLNALIMLANLSWREVLILRTYNNYLRQARFPYSRRYVEQVLALYPAIARDLVAYFHALHDPKSKEKADKHEAALLEKLQNVEKLDHDRILRSLLTLIKQTLRTNYYQPGVDGRARSLVAVKLDSKNLPDLPLPRPHVEIFVYSARVEAVHLRGGEIARGGIRWSDRHDDFRTEILGLLKAQTVKNTVIVPVGAKGGFIVKQPPQQGGREAYQKEGIECYKLFVQAMLDITDNSVKGKIVRPANVRCHDGIDPYLVVAADKGTATFSDIANGLSLAAGFWLGDAFASGGSAGYDHKKMGITAKGGWESVKRHFRELGKDIQREDFTVAGVGDMGGDVFGNAMLLSPHIQLVAAFNHQHIFLDPNPDVKKSFAERQRLFDTRGGWDQYDKSVLSAGGAVFERSLKTIKVSPQAKKRLGLTADSMTPDELIRAILKSDVELMWFGGIGTYIKSSRQSDAEADDKTNDSLRVDGRDVKARVLGEGANLGVTQAGRIEYARLGASGAGGKINTDFIDNSAGVDCSDHEVNIKILLTDVMAKHKMTLAQRDKLLASMTNDVSRLVLRDNYQQTQALSFQSYLGREQLNLQHEYIRKLEKDGLLKRQLEGLPDDESFARLARDGQTLTRPELSVLTSYAKIDLFNRLLKTDVPDDPALESLLVGYFPPALQKYVPEIRAHKLKREIIATEVVNMLINRMGAVFVASRMEKTGASAADVARAFLISANIFSARDLWAAIEALDNKVPAETQLAAYGEINAIMKRSVTWLLRFGDKNMPIKTGVERFAAPLEKLAKGIDGVLSVTAQEKIVANADQIESLGLPKPLARQIAVLRELASACDIVQIALRNKADIMVVARQYFMVGEVLGFDWLRTRATALKTENSWQARVKGAILDDLYRHQAVLSASLLQSKKKPADLPDSLRDQAGQIMGEIRHQGVIRLEMLVLVVQRLGQLADTAA